MLSSRTVAVAAVIVCLGGLAIAQDDDLPLSNWGAPPYWTPAPVPPAERGVGGGMLARAQGMTAKAEALPSSPLPFVAIPPCRIVDTRVATSDGFHQPNFADDEARTFDLPNSPDCPGLPATAGAYSVNIEYRPTSHLAYLTAFPTGSTIPTVSTLVGNPAWWTTNAAIVPAGTGGQIDIYCQFAGPVVIDINGYYAAQSLVTSVFGHTGDVVASPGDYTGAQITNVPSGTISATEVQGAVNQLESSKAALGHAHSALDITGLASGAVLFGSASGHIGQNANQLFWDTVNGRLGIGTNNLEQQLTITGNLSLPTTTAGGSSGVIMLGPSAFVHAFGWGNAFLGARSGNFTMEGSMNTGIGEAALDSNGSGWSNTAVGYGGLAMNSSGHANTACGMGSLEDNSTGSENTAVGTGSLGLSTTGNDNTGVGFASVSNNQAGTANTSLGARSLMYNTYGSENTATGYQALNNNASAGKNTAIGVNALYSQAYSYGNAPWDSYNTAVGHSSLYSNQPSNVNDGLQNTAVGARSLLSNTTGSNNIALGYEAGLSLDSGSFNIDIGNYGVAGEGHTIRIGDDNQSNTYIAGINGVAIPTGSMVLIDSTGHLGSVSSSLRFKRDVADMGDASSRLMELRPVTFHYKSQPGGPLQYGLIAEEVEQVMPELVVRDATGQVETVAYQELPAMLLNELQKQQAQISDQVTTVQTQRVEIAAQQARIDAQQSQIDELRRQVQILMEARNAPEGAKSTRP